MKVKKIAALLLAVGMVATMATGCGSGSSSVPAPALVDLLP